MNILELSNLDVYLENQSIVKNLNFAFKTSYKYSLYGSDLSGKNQFMKTISGLIEPESGSVQFKSKHLDYLLDPNYFIQRKNISTIVSGLQSFANLSLLENLEIPLKFQSTNDEKEIEDLSYLKLETIGLSKKSHLRPEKLSTEERMLLVCAMNIKQKTELLVIDNLFLHQEKEILEILRKLFSITIDLDKCTIICSGLNQELFPSYKFLYYKIDQNELKRFTDEVDENGKI